MRRTPTPVAPTLYIPASLSRLAVPAMSMWIQGFCSTNSWINRAAVMVPAMGPPTFFIICHLALDQFLIFFMGGKLPDLLAGKFGGGFQLFQPGVVVGDHGGNLVSQGSHRSTCEGGDIQHLIHLFPADGVVDGVYQREPSFRIGIDHLDGLAVHAADEVAGVVGFAGDHVFAGSHDAHDIYLEFEAAGGDHGSDHCSCSGHIAIHRHHTLRALDAISAAIVGYAFADEADGLFFASGLPW